MRRILLWTLALAALLYLGVTLALRSPAIQDRLLTVVMERAIRSNADALFADDALRVLICGSSNPFPHPTRAKPCVAVFAGGLFWIVDTGPGSWNNLALWRVDGARIGGVLFTHFHSDHIGELGEFDLQTWVAGRPGPLRVFGPPGVERVVAGFEEAYALDQQYRIAHHGSEFFSDETGRLDARPFPDPGPRGELVVLEEDGLRVTAFGVEHPPIVPAVGYRFDYRGRSAVVSGDTVKSANLIRVARAADVLVHGGLAAHMIKQLETFMARNGRADRAKILHDIQDYHATPLDAAESANEAGVGLLVLYHLTPPPQNAIVRRMFLRGVADVRPDGWLLSDDGLLVELPADSDEIRTSRIQ